MFNSTEMGPEIRIVEEGLNRKFTLRCDVDGMEQLHAVFTVYGEPSLNSYWC